MGKPPVWAIAVAIALVPAIARAAPPVCADPTACETACKTGTVAACTALADALAGGRRIAPDRKRAAGLYRTACALPDPDADATAATTDGDAAACMALADLTKTGWLFEVERDAALHRALVERAHDLATAHCTDADATGCAVAARAARERNALLPAGDADADPAEPGKLAERGCSQGRDRDACQLLRDLAAKSDKDTEGTRLRTVAETGLVNACARDGDGMACLLVGIHDPVARAAADKLCAKGDSRACGAFYLGQMLESRHDKAKLAKAFADLIGTCAGDGNELCPEIAERLVTGNARFGLEANPAAAIGIGERRCELGDVDGCSLLSELIYGPTGPTALRDPAMVKKWGERTCALTAPDQPCKVCATDPTIPECQRRAAFAEHQRCFAGEVGMCERIGARFRDGTGVDKDPAAAARYLRRGCDAAEKTACVALDDLCVATPTLPDDLCQQALIHSDLFYEAEWQQETNGTTNLVDPTAPAAATPAAPAVAMAAEASAGAGVSLRRGKLDADLVVDIVLDRARQAAIKLVVDELIGAERKARYRYLADLLDQGAALLADPSTLRREKFQDLGMTVVRAFVASNLVDGLYPGAEELIAAPIVGPSLAGLGVVAGTPVPAAVHGYLVDVAYRWLGETRLFGRTESNARADAPGKAQGSCPWPDGAGAALCTSLADRATVEKILHVDRVLDGIRLAKALREAGFDELRRLIEAVSRSRTIADLGKTPGLNLSAWKSVLVAETRDRVGRLRAQLVDLRTLMRAGEFADTGPELAVLAERAAAARSVLDSRAIRLVVGSDNSSHLMRIVRSIELAAPHTTKVGVPIAADADALAKVRKDATTELIGWGMRDLADLGRKLDKVQTELDALRPAVDQLETAIAETESVFARFPRADGKIVLDVGSLPLFAIGDLIRDLRTAATALGTVEDQLRKIYPGEVQAQLQFARSATVRLLGFLDLMERVARSSRLTQTCGEVIAALGTLGSTRHGEFTAPLYDVLEPVLGAIKTHEPMSLDLLFAVIARVRLDTLIGSLQGSGNACAHDNNVDCWTVKLVHALQESVERDGDLIRVDGGKFAQRLAKHGDDFRRKHTWRGYFHLTVGVGGMRSDPVDDDTKEMRNVPLISEQVGFGWASPAFLGERLTFKVGAAASGLLYRAVLDSKESNAIMIHPVFLALDVGDLIEAYVSPAMILVYPPTDDRGTEIRYGFSAGISVPLSAYLEKL